MLSKNEVKYIQSLYQKKTRNQEGLFVAEGVKILEELASSDYHIRKVYATDRWLQPENLPAEVARVSEDELNKISNLQTASQVLAIVEQKYLSSKPVFQNTFTLMLDNIHDPGNLGTIIRIADWFGVQQVVASNETVELYNPKVIQSTMGSFVRVNVWYSNLAEVISTASVSVYGALLYGENVFDLGKIQEGIVLIGNESKGISEAIKQFITHPITIPKKGGAESLNAAVATGIILSHIY